MTGTIQIAIDRDVFERLQVLMVPPFNDANAVIRELLVRDGRSSPAASSLKADEQHFTYAQELERARQGVYECGGGT